MNSLALVLTLAIIMPAWTRDVSAQATERDVPFDYIAGGSAEHVRGSIDLVINDQEVWEAMWGLLHEGNPTVPPLPQVDFNERMLIVVGMGLQPTVGGNITVDRIAVTRQGVARIYIRQSTPGRSCAPILITASPYKVYETERLFSTTFRRSIDPTLCPQ